MRRRASKASPIPLLSSKEATSATRAPACAAVIDGEPTPPHQLTGSAGRARRAGVRQQAGSRLQGAVRPGAAPCSLRPREPSGMPPATSTPPQRPSGAASSDPARPTTTRVSTRTRRYVGVGRGASLWLRRLLSASREPDVVAYGCALRGERPRIPG